ncbi:MAG: TldD/PmbA family protein [Anaerolineae bacterium]
MLGPDKVKELTQQALAFSKADQTEVLVTATDSALTRFANNAIHQNVAESNASVRVRVVLGKRIGVAESNDLSPEGLRRAVEIARAIAQLQPENPDFTSLPHPLPIAGAESYVQQTADYSPEARARVVESICRQSGASKLTAAGAYKTASFEIAIANSFGLFAYHPGTVADLHTAVMSDSGSGYASAASPDVRDLNGEALAREAIDKAMRSRNPITLQPGAYTVLLEEYAVSDVVDFLGTLSFNALAVQEERSFMRGRLGERVMDEKVTLGDDALASDTFAVPFDYEGVPSQPVTFVENGIARGVVYDSSTAGKEGKQSTGHSLPAPNPWGPMPLHMYMRPGQSSREEMIRGVERGVLVTRFWYTRVVHPLHVTITGMTRDGTFLIEHGEVTQPLKNMRFTTSYLDALNHVLQIGRETKLFHSDWAGMSVRVPALLVDGWEFTGVTQ